MTSSIGKLVVGTAVRVRRHRDNGASTGVKLAAAAVFLGLGLAGGPACASPDGVSDVAHVEYVTGRVVAFAHGRPTLLDTLDTVGDHTQLDLLANSELHLCHYQLHKLVTLKGPLRVSISEDGVTVENGKAVIGFAGTCATPTVSTSHGGFVSRNVRTGLQGN